MSVDSFDAGKLPADLVAMISKHEAAMANAGKLPADLVARISEHEAAMAISPALAAKLAEFAAQQAQDALRDFRAWRRDLDRREELDFLVRERAAERRQRAAAGHPGNAAPAVRPDRMQPPAAPAAVVALWPTAAAAAEARAPAAGTASRGLIRTPREKWRNARGHWTDEVLAEADRLMSRIGGNHSEVKVAKALGITRQSLQEALRRWTARGDKAKAAAR